jgi:hypothetical protein
MHGTTATGNTVCTAVVDILLNSDTIKWQCVNHLKCVGKDTNCFLHYSRNFSYLLYIKVQYRTEDAGGNLKEDEEKKKYKQNNKKMKRKKEGERKMIKDNKMRR